MFSKHKSEAQCYYIIEYVSTSIYDWNIKQLILPLYYYLPQSFLKLKHKCKATVRSRVWHTFLLSKHIKLNFSVSRWPKKISRLFLKKTTHKKDYPEKSIMNLWRQDEGFDMPFSITKKHPNPNQTSITPHANFCSWMPSYIYNWPIIHYKKVWKKKLRNEN